MRGGWFFVLIEDGPLPYPTTGRIWAIGMAHAHDPGVVWSILWMPWWKEITISRNSSSDISITV
eukprot:scaffold3238_cov91-Cylindrotheca_fusiformis.AAC.10